MQSNENTTLSPTLTFHHADALAWLKNLPGPMIGTSIITSLPDISEFGEMNLEQWKSWFMSSAELVLSKCAPDGICIFYQSDIKRDGVWVDKSYLCQKAAEQTGDVLIAHKIICRSPPGNASFGRVGYSHLLCFSKTIRPTIADSVADVLPDAGQTTWARGMGLEACEMACRFIKTHSESPTILDPFCGHGAVLRIANKLGLNAIGVDRSLKYLKKAQAMHDDGQLSDG